MACSLYNNNGYGSSVQDKYITNIRINIYNKYKNKYNDTYTGCNKRAKRNKT